MKSAAEILREHHIEPPSGNERYTTCPKCSAARSTLAHQKQKVLGVTTTNDGVCWGCNHCGWTGGRYFNGNGKDYDPVVAHYEYPDKDGVVLFRKNRTAQKKFWIQHPDGRGGWANGGGGTQRVLYRLPELLADLGTGQTITSSRARKT
jgi:hypothetical protein